MSTSTLTSLPNIGSVLAEELAQTVVGAPEDLRRLGSVEAAVRVARAGRTECYSMLCALEGAIRGVRWHRIPKEERSDLKRRFYEAMAKDASSS